MLNTPSNDLSSLARPRAKRAVLSSAATCYAAQLSSASSTNAPFYRIAAGELITENDRPCPRRAMAGAGGTERSFGYH